MKHYLLMLCAAALAGTVLSAPADAQLARELGLIPPDSSSTAAAIATPAPALPTESAFALAQMRHDRVLDARVEMRFQIKRLFHERGLRYPAAEMLLRIFKRERSLEVWVRPEADDQFTLLKTYGICALAGELGPKRRQGDTQVPEGFYQIDFFNPTSEYHLSLHLDYPNRYDRMAASEGVNLGGDIFIHGGCNSEGCLALTDNGIKELYWMAVEARSVGQQTIPVHIFPARLVDEDFALLQKAFSDRPALGEFWASLKPVYDYFEEHRRLPVVTVDARGAYNVNGVPTGRPLGRAANVETPSAVDGTGTNDGPKPIGRPVGG